MLFYHWKAIRRFNSKDSYRRLKFHDEMISVWWSAKCFWCCRATKHRQWFQLHVQLLAVSIALTNVNWPWVKLFEIVPFWIGFIELHFIKIDSKRHAECDSKFFEAEIERFSLAWSWTNVVFSVICYENIRFLSNFGRNNLPLIYKLIINYITIPFWDQSSHEWSLSSL